MTALPERKTFYLSNNGCVRRKLDAQHTFDFLIANGYQEVKDPGLAELLLFFTCSADDASEATARLAILDLARRKAKTAQNRRWRMFAKGKSIILGGYGLRRLRARTRNTWETRGSD